MDRMELPEATRCAACRFEININGIIGGLGPNGCPACGCRSTWHTGRSNTVWAPIETVKMLREGKPTKDAQGRSLVAKSAMARRAARA